MADEEIQQIKSCQGDEENTRNNSSKIILRNHRGYDYDELERDYETEKSKEARRHDSMERKKELSEENDYGGKNKNRAKHREKEAISFRDAEKRSSREIISNRRDKRKEDQEGYAKEKKKLKIDKGKSKDKILDRDYDRTKHREDKENERAKDKWKEHDKEKDTNNNREQSIVGEYEIVRPHGKDNDNEQNFREKEFDWDTDIDHVKEQSIDMEHDQSQHAKNRAREAEMDRELLRECRKERGKLHDHHKDRDTGWESIKDKEHYKRKIRDRDLNKKIDNEFERDKVRDKDCERGKNKEKENDKHGYQAKDKEREKLKDREKGSINRKVGEWGKFEKDKGKQNHQEKELNALTKTPREGSDKNRDARDKDVEVDKKFAAKNKTKIHEIGDTDDLNLMAMDSQISSEQERLKKKKEEKVKGNSDAVLTGKEKLDEDSEVLFWVNKSRKLEEKRNVEKEKAMALSRMLDDQDKVLDESEGSEPAEDSTKDLAGMKVLHGLDKVIQGSTVVLTLKDQNILADGDINEEVDMLENVEIGEQKRRNEAYKAAKRKTGKFNDKFNEDPASKKTILPQYDDPVDDEGVTFDESGRFNAEAEKQLSELRKQIEGNKSKIDYEDLSSSLKIQSDYFTTEEMLQFKKPKKKKSLRKKEKLNLDDLETEARSAGLGLEDRGSRGDTMRLSAREEEERNMAKARSNAYQVALAKAEEASKALRMGPTSTSKTDDYDNLVFGEDYEDLQNSLEQARKLALKKQEVSASSGPQAVALLAAAHKDLDGAQNSAAGDTLENKVVITEMEEFVLGLQTNEETNNLGSEDVFKDDDDAPMSFDQETMMKNGGWAEAKDSEMDELPVSRVSGDATLDEIIHETAVGKGLAGALKLLKDRGTLKESIDWGGRNMDKKKSKLIGIYANDGSKEIRIERTDEFGRIMTPKEAFRLLSHKFHGKGPGKMKQEKRMKQYHEDLKAKHMKDSDTPLLAMEKMREAQVRLKTPYLVLSGHVKPGQTSDPRSGFATVEKDNPGSLTPMLGDKKVEHFLGIRSRMDSGSMGRPPPKKPKL